MCNVNNAPYVKINAPHHPRNGHPQSDHPAEAVASMFEISVYTRQAVDKNGPD